MNPATVPGVALLLIASTALAGEDHAVAGNDLALRLIDFEMEDQFGAVHRRSDYEGRIVLMIGSDRNGSAYADAWRAALHDSLHTAPLYDEKVAYLPVTDVHGVPFFLKGMTRRRFSQEPDEWALIDWEGTFAKAYGWRDGVTNVVLFAPDGSRSLHVFGREPHVGGLHVLVETARGLLVEMDRRERFLEARERNAEKKRVKPDARD